MGRTLPVALCLLVLLAPARADERTEHLLAEVRRDADPVAWKAAVDALAAGTPEERALLLDLLGRMAEERRRDLVSAVRHLDAVAEPVGDGARYEKRRTTWEEARARATAWIFDEDEFPDPGERVVTGPMIGYEQAKLRGDAAIEAWHGLASALDRAVRPARWLDARKARALLDGWERARDALRRVTAELPEERRTDGEAPAPDPLAVLLVRLGLGDLPAVAEAYAGMAPSWRTLCLFYAYVRAVERFNEEHSGGLDRGGRAGMEAINAYRVALGISPLAINEKLVRTAAKHSEEMVKLGYFSHRSPVEGRTTKEERAALEGYHALLVECITGVGSGQRAVDFWKFDGGHHRDMVHPKWVEGGFSTRGPAVYVGGSGEEGSFPVLRY